MWYVCFCSNHLSLLLQHTGESPTFVSREEQHPWVCGESSGRPVVEQGHMRVFGWLTWSVKLPVGEKWQHSATWSNTHSCVNPTRSTEASVCQQVSGINIFLSWFGLLKTQSCVYRVFTWLGSAFIFDAFEIATENNFYCQNKLKRIWKNSQMIRRNAEVEPDTGITLKIICARQNQKQMTNCWKRKWIWDRMWTGISFGGFLTGVRVLSPILVRSDASEQLEVLFFGLCSQPAGPWASVGAGARKQPVLGWVDECDLAAYIL